MPCYAAMLMSPALLPLMLFCLLPLWRAVLLLSLCCHAAIRYGHALMLIRPRCCYYASYAALHAAMPRQRHVTPSPLMLLLCRFSIISLLRCRQLERHCRMLPLPRHAMLPLYAIFMPRRYRRRARAMPLLMPRFHVGCLCHGTRTNAACFCYVTPLFHYAIAAACRFSLRRLSLLHAMRQRLFRH